MCGGASSRTRAIDARMVTYAGSAAVLTIVSMRSTSVRSVYVSSACGLSCGTTVASARTSAKTALEIARRAGTA